MMNNNATLKKLIKTTLEIESESSPDLTMEENLCKSLDLRLPNCNAKNVIAELISGSKHFYDLLQKEDTIAESDIEKNDFYNNLSAKELNAVYNDYVKTLNAAFKFMKENPQYGFNEYKFIDEVHNRDVSSNEVAEISDAYKIIIDEMTPLLFDDEASAIGLDNASFKGDEKVFDEKHKLYMALAFYILNQQGELENISVKATPFSVGAIISAAVEAVKCKTAGIIGKISWDEVKSILQKIGKTLIHILETSALVFLLWTLFGTSVMVFIGKLVIALGIVYTYYEIEDWIESGNAEILFENLFTKTKTVLKDIADKAEAINEKITSWHKEFLVWIQAKLQCFKNKTIKNSNLQYKENDVEPEDTSCETRHMSNYIPADA